MRPGLDASFMKNFCPNEAGLGLTRLLLWLLLLLLEALSDDEGAALSNI